MNIEFIFVFKELSKICDYLDNFVDHTALQVRKLKYSFLYSCGFF